MVVTNNDLSRPRRVVYNSPLPPKPAPSEAPRCCSKIKTTIKMDEIKIIVCKIAPIFILLSIIRRNEEIDKIVYHTHSESRKDGAAKTDFDIGQNPNGETDHSGIDKEDKKAER